VTVTIGTGAGPAIAGAAPALASVAAQLYARGWMEGTAGNISVRLPGGDTALITASGLCKGSLTEHDVVEVGVEDARPVYPDAPRPSAETTIHTALYRLSAACGAVVHAHPPYATAVATMAARTGVTAVEFTELEIIKGLGVADPSSVAVPVFANHRDVPRIAADVTERLRADASPVLLIGAHGATTWGPTLDVARNRMECLEALCQLRLLLDRP
jgi:methylthioribose-1-phosphate isomerase/methylthioribulose-1-phosphate dehydratase